MALDLGLTLTLPDDHKFRGTYTLRLGECTGIDDIDCLRETDRTVFELFTNLATKVGMAAITAAAILWLVRRRDFPAFTFRVAAESIPWDTDFTLEDADPDGDEGKAPASEPSSTSTDSPPTSSTSTVSSPGSANS